LVNIGCARGIIYGQNQRTFTGEVTTQYATFEFELPTRLKRTKGGYYYLKDDKELPVKEASVFNHYKDPSARRVLGEMFTPKTTKQILDIHRIYIDYIHSFFKDGGIPEYLLVRNIDVNKEPNILSNISRNEITEEIERFYSNVNGANGRKNVVGLRGDWDLKQLGSPIENILQPQIVQWIELTISAHYGVPPSLFWAGLQYSNQRASRQSDSIDFYQRTISNLLQRLEERLTKFFCTILNDSNSKFKVQFDRKTMPLAQDVLIRDGVQVQREWTQKMLTREQMSEKAGIDVSHLTEEEKKSYYDGSPNLNSANGDKATQANNGLE
jgi:hypothetical protein